MLGDKRSPRARSGPPARTRTRPINSGSRSGSERRRAPRPGPCGTRRCGRRAAWRGACKGTKTWPQRPSSKRPRTGPTKRSGCRGTKKRKSASGTASAPEARRPSRRRPSPLASWRRSSRRACTPRATATRARTSRLWARQTERPKGDRKKAAGPPMVARGTRKRASSRTAAWARRGRTGAAPCRACCCWWCSRCSGAWRCSWSTPPSAPRASRRGLRAPPRGRPTPRGFTPRSSRPGTSTRQAGPRRGGPSARSGPTPSPLPRPPPRPPPRPVSRLRVTLWWASSGPLLTGRSRRGRWRGRPSESGAGARPRSPAWVPRAWRAPPPTARLPRPRPGPPWRPRAGCSP
mmetsp:Transcript_19452/g.44134  ORF Transcript_19452/g.44134 Transcript_19452/m.44134 type:complete len:348 (+) Transcript_19452:622-1665(+)